MPFGPATPSSNCVGHPFLNLQREAALTPERTCPAPWAPGKNLLHRGDRDLGNSSHTWITMAELPTSIEGV